MITEKDKRGRPITNKVFYSKDRSMVVYKNTLVCQFSDADLLEFEGFLDHKDVGKLDPELLLAVLPNQLHLLSILMQNEQLFVEVCGRIHE